MILDLVRSRFTTKSTIGSLGVNGRFACYILENPLTLNPDLGPEHIAIPEGNYPITIYDSPHFGFPVMSVGQVTNRSNIEIHPGNTDVDTHGCLLPGNTRADDFVGESKLAFEALFNIVKSALDRGEPVNLQISSVHVNT